MIAFDFRLALDSPTTNGYKVSVKGGLAQSDPIDFQQQLVQRTLTQLVARRMSDHRSAPTPDYSADCIAQCSPLMRRVTGLAPDQVFLEYRFHILGVAALAQKRAKWERPISPLFPA